MSGHPQANGLTPRPTRTTGPRRSSSARSCEGFVQAVNKFEFRTYVSALEGLEEDGVGELLGGRSEEVKKNAIGPIPCRLAAGSGMWAGNAAPV